MIKKVLAAGVLVLASLIAAPLAANAAGDTYGTPVDSGAAVSTQSGQPITVAVNVDALVDGTANVSVVGPDTAVVVPAVTSTGTANVRSSVAYFTITPNSPGVYTATLTGGVLLGTATVTVRSLDALGETGVSDPTPTIWLAGGLVAVGIALIVTFVAVRRQNAKLKVNA